ncbi:MAG TPA: hypothetical protein VFG55_04820 [Rhodanobacteraceae bacterium]|nr:hypothetical protein [Rhodanobacteraceae bacterium]
MPTASSKKIASRRRGLSGQENRTVDDRAGVPSPVVHEEEI